MLNSNLYCMFNLPTDITKLQIQNDTDFGKVNSAFLAATQYVADNDVFNYAIENKDTDQNLGSTYKALTGSDIFRNNTAGSYYMATQLAASSSVTSRTETITDLNSFYLNLASFSNWKGYSAKFGIIMLNEGYFRDNLVELINNPGNYTKEQLYEAFLEVAERYLDEMTSNLCFERDIIAKLGKKAGYKEINRIAMSKSIGPLGFYRVRIRCQR